MAKFFGKGADKAKLYLDGSSWEVPSEKAFPMRRDCSVRLFQDAACDPVDPQLVDENGERVEYQRGQCWEEVYNAINEAKRFVYITGWSVDTTKTLLRTSRHGSGDDETIGELLRRKSYEGCTVMVHIWDEKMSTSRGGEVKSEGLMCTHDEDTALFFAGTPVHVAMSYRPGKSSGHAFIFTHHQKSVIVDAPLIGEEGLSREEGLKRKQLAQDYHAKLKELIKAERARKKEERKKLREAGEEVEDSSDEDEDDEDIIKHEIKMKRKQMMKKKKEKKHDSSSSDSDSSSDDDGPKKGPFKKRREKRKEKKKAKEAKKKKGEKKEHHHHHPDPHELIDKIKGGDLDDQSLNQVADMFDSDFLESLPGGGANLVAKIKETAASSSVGRRRVIAFVGGLDLCDGRWDTQYHRLYRTLQHEHKRDFHNPWPVSQDCGPREPWHDIHSRVEGRVARDVMQNFIQRWKKQAPKKLQGHLLQVTPDYGFLSDEEDNAQAGEESWNVQLFRSIDNFSATIEGVEQSIQECYINSIRKAEHFIYLENQYFLGSCQYWHKNKHAGCENLVPFEIANKIGSKIRKKEQFNVYIVIPMYPEGLVEDAASQEILKWQRRTQQMMNRTVFEAIRETYGIGADVPVVTDYLNFYCLGNRETVEGSEAKVPDPSALPKKQAKDETLAKSRRFSVYVHSKMMIVDDVYVIVGSANINERSLSGDRDSEIAIGAYQPKYQTSGGKGGKGEVHKFRMSLWQEHLNMSHPLFSNPNSVECAHLVNEVAQKNMEAYGADGVVEMDSHLIKYPILVDGKGETINYVQYIPDTKGLFGGNTSFLMVDKLTT